MLSGSRDGGSPPHPRMWHNGYLPGRYQGCPFRGGKEPVFFVANPDGVDAKARRRILDGVKALERARSRGDRQPRRGDAHPGLRDGGADADERARADRPLEGARRRARTVRRGAGQGVVRQQLPAGPAARRARRPLHPDHGWRLGPPRQHPRHAQEEDGGGGQADRGAPARPQGPRPAGRHGRDLLRRVRPHELLRGSAVVRATTAATTSSSAAGCSSSAAASAAASPTARPTSGAGTS